MDRQIIPFWEEQMTELEKEEKTQQLFELLSLQWQNKYATAPKQPLFIFVPDPPSPFFEVSEHLHSQVLGFEWGTKGKAYAFSHQKIASEWTATFFELKSDLLYVFVFEGVESLEKDTLKVWVEQVLILQKEMVNEIPPYVLLTFDWGDLVEDS